MPSSASVAFPDQVLDRAGDFLDWQTRRAPVSPGAAVPEGRRRRHLLPPHGGVKVVEDLYVIGGGRRLALKYNILLGDLPAFERKPGVWDPLMGLGWHLTFRAGCAESGRDDG